MSDRISPIATPPRTFHAWIHHAPVFGNLGPAGFSLFIVGGVIAIAALAHLISMFSDSGYFEFLIATGTRFYPDKDTMDGPGWPIGLHFGMNIFMILFGLSFLCFGVVFWIDFSRFRHPKTPPPPTPQS